MSDLTHLAGAVVWLTGVPASGKTTLAQALVESLRAQGVAVLWLDSDALRTVLTPEPTYSPEERDWFYEVIGALAALGAQGGAAVVVSATGVKRAWREAARARVDRFYEIEVTADEDILRARDPKGLYARADKGEISDLPGVGVPYEPSTPDEAFVIDTTGRRPDQSEDALFSHLAR